VFMLVEVGGSAGEAISMGSDAISAVLVVTECWSPSDCCDLMAKIYFRVYW
jgi:hypothetical protein